MSASDKKKLRKEEKEAMLTERQLAEQKEAKKLKITSTLFIVAIGLVFVIGIVMLAHSWLGTSGISDRTTTAVQIGEHKLSVAELNYYYVDMVNELSQDWYSMYLLTSEEGLNSSVSLDDQLYHGEEGKTWGDYFIEMTIEEASGVLALCDDAKAKGYTMTEEEKATIDDTMVAMETQAMLNGFGNFTDFLKAVYGNGAEKKTYRQYVENLTLAQSYYNNYTESLSYTADQIDAFEKENGSYSAFDYTYFHVSPEDFLEHANEDEHEHSDEELAAALKTAKETADALAASGATNKEELDKAIAGLTVYNPTAEETTAEETTAEETTTEETTTEETTGEATTEEATATTDPAAETTAATEASTEATTEATAEATTEAATEPTTEATEPEEEEETTDIPTSVAHSDYDYSTINTAIGEWLISAEHKAGEIAVVPYYALDEDGNKTEEIESYYVVIFGAENKHEDKLVSVRHILINYEGGTENEDSGETEYSEAEKKAAEDKILEIKAEWEAGEKTAETFGELAKKYTKDSNGDEGGLYDEVYPGWAVEEFDAWCFDDSRKPGDVGVVHTEYGCHLIYFVEEKETTHREYMITTDMRATDSDEWFTALRDVYKNAAKVGKTSGINTDIVLAG